MEIYLPIIIIICLYLVSLCIFIFLTEFRLNKWQTSESHLDDGRQGETMMVLTTRLKLTDNKSPGKKAN